MHSARRLIESVRRCSDCLVKDEATPCLPRPPPQNRRESRNRPRCMTSPSRSAPEGRFSRKLQLHHVQANSSCPPRERRHLCRCAQSGAGLSLETYATLITEDNSDAKEQMKRRMTRYLQENRIAVDGMTASELVDALYTEMAEYGFFDQVHLRRRHRGDRYQFLARH